MHVASGTAQPLYWQRPVYELDPTDPNNNGFINDDLIVWMREAAFPNFKKLYGILNRAPTSFSQGLPAGNYSVLISYSILTAQHWSWSEGVHYMALTSAPACFNLIVSIVTTFTFRLRIKICN